MRIDILTLFPDMLENILSESIIGRAQKNGLLEINFVDIRDFTLDKHRRVDAYPYGGGCGMVMQAPPIYNAYKSLLKEGEDKPYVIYTSPQGKVLNQKKALELSKEEHIVILCGHYEGVDQRIIDEIVDEEISIGDYVLTGGELPAAVICDTVGRLVPGVLAPGSCSDESHFDGMLEYPQYTRPPEFLGRTVPEVLLSGNHGKIAEWRKEQSRINTEKKRPDLISKKREEG